MIYQVDNFPGREISIEGKSYRYFGGTSYLGLQTNPGFQDLFIKNIKKYGTNYGASRKSNIRLSLFEKTETALANLVGSEACITVSSGYLAGKLVAQHFDDENYKCFYAPNTHSALFQKNTVCFKNFKDFTQAISEFIASSQIETPVVFLDSIDTKEASYPDFKGLEKLPLNKVILVVDDSHGIGILGKNGGGAYKKIKKLAPKELLVCGSLGKGFGIQAGTILGGYNRIGELTSTDFFGGASPAAPSALATFSESQDIYKEQRKKLQVNLELFLSLTNDLSNFHFIKKHPVFIFENPALSAYLIANGILTTNFKYPNDDGVMISRIVVSAGHTKPDIERLAKILNSH